MTTARVPYERKPRCEGKRRWMKRQADGLAIFHRSRNRLINAYHCPDCGWWHIGHSPNAAAGLWVTKR